MAKSDISFIVTDDYKNWIDHIKKRIKRSQVKASVKINYELLDLYW